MQNTWHNILRLHSDQTQVFLFILMTAVRFGGAGIRGFLERKCHQMWHCGGQLNKLVIRPAAWMNETTVTHIMCRVLSLTFTHLWMLTITLGPTCLTYCSRCMTSDQRHQVSSRASYSHWIIVTEGTLQSLVCVAWCHTCEHELFLIGQHRQTVTRRPSVLIT